MRAFVTGISGFVGGSLADFLISNNWEVSGFDHRESDKIRHTYIGNILDQVVVAEAIKASQPDVVFHLAGTIKANLAKDYFVTNVLGTLSLFEALVETGYRPRVVISSSSAVYGSGLGKRPINENFALHPMTNYAASKMAQEIIARRFFGAHNIPVIIMRTFNLVGPGQSPELACSAFARQIAIDENHAKPEPIRTGNLSAQRDFVDVRDAARAYESLAQKGIPGEVYNVCSGQAVSLRQCLGLLLGMASKPLTTELDTNRLQSNDVPIQVGSAKLIQRTIGWKPQITLQQSLLDLLYDWRKRVKSTTE